jgi:L-2-hydroxycarboxylate dehydrogenase (NAD+)
LLSFREAIFNGLKSEGHNDNSAAIIADVLLFAELRANNQGIIKLITGALKSSPAEKELNTVFDTPVSAQIDGGHQSGMVVVARAVDLAIEKATKTGISVVGASGYASATGALGYWAKRIAEKGFVAIVMTQCSGGSTSCRCSLCCWQYRV